MKKLIAALLCAMMIVSSVVTVAASSASDIAFKGNSARVNHVVGDDYILGDANNDGVADAKDLLELKRHLVGMETGNLSNANIVLDGSVDAKDYLALKKCQADVDSLENYKGSDYAVDKFTIAGNDISEYDIVYFEDTKLEGVDPYSLDYDPSDIDYALNNYFAADTLRKYINIATGINLGTTTTQERAHKIEFINVDNDPALEEELEIENYKYEVRDGDLYIYGTRRGAMYAVYEILEEYLGFRFYNDTFTYQYSERFVDIPEGTSVFHNSYLEFRICKQSFWRNNEAHYFARHLNGSQHGESDVAHGTLTGPHFINAHSYGYYWMMATTMADVDVSDATSVSDYAKYSAKDVKKNAPNEATWNPCFTCDGDYATLFRGLLETIRYCQSWGHTFRKDTSLMSFSICDNRTVCTCVECQFVAKKGSTGVGVLKYTRLGCGEAGLNLYMANRACDDIKKYYDGRAASVDSYGPDEEQEIEYCLGEIDSGYGQAIKDEYPDLRLYTILYDHTVPHEKLFSGEGYVERFGYGYDAIIPRDNLCIMFCGNPCNNHYMGANECNGNLNMLGDSGEKDAEAFAAWGDVTKRSGATMWFWYYPVNYNTYVTDSPNIFNIWYDFKYVVEECNVTGIYYEGASKGYLFENLKAHLAAEFMWSMVEDENGNLSYMSYDEFLEVIEEYLMIHYGKGWEYVYEYIKMQDEAGNVNDVKKYNADGTPLLDENGDHVSATICYINNLDYMGDMFDYEYMNENYEEMRELIQKGWALVDSNDAQMYQRYEFLWMNIEILGLSAVRKSWYLSETATAEQKQTYMERYDALFEFLTTERMNEGDNINGREWNSTDWDNDLKIEPFKHLYLNMNKPYNWPEEIAKIKDYYKLSPYGLVTGDWVEETNEDLNRDGKIEDYFEPGGETWRKYSEGWEWTGSTPSWGYYG